MRFPSPPSPKVLEKIAEASRGITDYDELMQVCGHLNSNISSKEIIAQNICKDFEKEINDLNIPNIDINYLLFVHQD